MIVDSVEVTLSGVVKIAMPDGSFFFLRQPYLQTTQISDFFVGAEFSQDDVHVLEALESTLCYTTEKKALDYLNRSEHSRFLLEQKLKAKKYGIPEIKAALDYLEEEQLLSDKRYALAWLRTRRITKSEGRVRLASELASRGVEKKVIQDALDEFFAEFDEDEILLKAIEKLNKKNLSYDEMVTALVKKGFPLTNIKKIYQK